MSITYGLIASWYLNFIDIVMIYVLVNRLIGYSVKNTFKQTTIGIIGIGILLGAVLGALPYFTNMLLYQAVMFVVTLSIALWIVKKRKEHYSFDDILILYFLYYLMVNLIAVSLFILFSNLRLDSIIAQIITYTLA